MFRGSSYHTIDAKGRIIIPARFRDLIKGEKAEGVMLSQLDGALVAYPFETWGAIERRILGLAERNATIRRFRRVFVAGAFPCECDRQERILVPPSLRKYAQLEREIVLAGVLDHFEIWSRENWERENQAMEQDMRNESVRNEIARLGL